MTPVEVCRLAAVGEHTEPKVKKLLNTLSDRRHVPFVKSGTARTAPRLYSLVSAAMLRTIYEIVKDGRTYRYAQPVAEMVGARIVEIASTFDTPFRFDEECGGDRIVFSGITADGAPRRIRWATGDVWAEFEFTYSVLDAGYLIYRIVEIYAEFWGADLVRRGEIEPEADRIGPDGWPVAEGHR